MPVNKKAGVINEILYFRSPLTLDEWIILRENME